VCKLTLNLILSRSSLLK
jgi:hypothetical protein